MKYTETSNTINIQDAMPSKTYGDDYFQFTIEGKNTYTKPIWYEIVINWGEEPEGRSVRIPDEFLRFRLTEQLPGEEEQEVIANGKYSDFSKGKKIWVNKIDAKSAETTITYKLYMWISDEMVLGSGDAAASTDMDMETWNNDAFASVKVSVNGDFNEKELEKERILTGPSVDVIKDTIGQTGGVVGVVETEDDTIAVTNETSNIREYRYSGEEVNNYVYFNCEDEATKETASEKCEKWRILGVFKDESGQQHLKIVRDEPLSGFPETYKVGETTYNIKGDSDTTAYWNKKVEGEANNDWAEAGLMNWLNSKGDEGEDIGYLNSLHQNSQNMIMEMQYYLGAIKVWDSDGIEGNVKEVYNNERKVTGCADNKGPIENSSENVVDENETCRVWANQAATWPGKIALMYPSNILLSQNNNSWSFYFEGVSQTWFKQFDLYLLSPPLVYHGNGGRPVGYLNMKFSYLSSYSIFDADSLKKVYPTLYLDSKVNITAGLGNEQEPYFLSGN